MSITSSPVELSERRIPARLVSVAAAVFVMSIAGSALEAYSLGPVPVPWLAEMTTVLFVAGFLLGRHRTPLPFGAKFLVLFILWAAVITIVNALCYDYSLLLPELATTPYPIFVGLRFARLFAVGSQLCLVYWLLQQGYGEWMIRTLVTIAIIVSLAGLYIYFAQSYNLWEPPRTRLGTNGGEQITEFNYAFHRAMGTFREPSHLAEWLVIPLFLSLLTSGLQRGLGLVVPGLMLLLTGSLTGICGAAIGFGSAMLLQNPFRARNVRVAISLSFALMIAMVGFNFVAVAYSSGNTDLSDIIWARIEPILFDDGVYSTNRAFAYEYFDEAPIPVFGYGMGNANLLMSDYLGFLVVASFTNLYLNTLYSTGYSGFVILMAFHAAPIIASLHYLKSNNQRRALILLSAYISWLVIFLVHCQELTIAFATIYALVSYETMSKNETFEEDRNKHELRRSYQFRAGLCRRNVPCPDLTALD